MHAANRRNDEGNVSSVTNRGTANRIYVSSSGEKKDHSEAEYRRHVVGERKKVAIAGCFQAVALQSSRQFRHVSDSELILNF